MKFEPVQNAVEKMSICAVADECENIYFAVIGIAAVVAMVVSGAFVYASWS